jgi:hypothetical protein
MGSIVSSKCCSIYIYIYIYIYMDALMYNHMKQTTRACYGQTRCVSSNRSTTYRNVVRMLAWLSKIMPQSMYIYACMWYIDDIIVVDNDGLLRSHSWDRWHGWLFIMCNYVCASSLLVMYTNVCMLEPTGKVVLYVYIMCTYSGGVHACIPCILQSKCDLRACMPAWCYDDACT